MAILELVPRSKGASQDKPNHPLKGRGVARPAQTAGGGGADIIVLVLEVLKDDLLASGSAMEPRTSMAASLTSWLV